MNPGDMLQVLSDAELDLPKLLLEGPETWQTLDIDYEPPHVERLWRPWGEFRISLHRIWPCRDPALFHPHPWPSAMRVVRGAYTMGIGYSEPGYRPCEVARVVLEAPSVYEMVSQQGWHFVRPMGANPSLSVMVTARPWETQIFDHDKFGKAANLKPLSDEKRIEVHRDFVRHYC